ncbi:Protein of unknown function, partial [Gryllus bimaculatus]
MAFLTLSFAACCLWNSICPSNGIPVASDQSRSLKGKALLLPRSPPKRPSAPFIPWGRGISLEWPCDANNPEKRLLWMVAQHIGQVHCYEGSDADFTKRQAHIFTEPRRADGGSSFLYPYAQDAMCVVVKKTPPRRQNIAMTFAGPVWLLLAASLATFALLQHLLATKG